MSRSLLSLAVLLVVAVALAACGDDNGGGDESDSGAQIDFAAASGITGGDPEFNYSALVWQGYWLSRDQFGPFVMGSGIGITFEPPMDMVMAGMQMVARNPDDPVQILQNMAPIQAVFASGSPDLVNDPREFDPLDLEAFRLDPTTFDETVTVRGQAETMLKESQWAHNFADPHFGDPEGDFGAQQRFIGMMVSMLAQMQGAYAMQNLLADDGLYHDSDGTLDYTGNWVMLHVLSDIAGLTGDEGGRYLNPDAHPMFEDGSAALFRALTTRVPASPQEAASAIRALAYFVSTTDSSGSEAARANALAIADEQLVDLSSDDVTEVSAAIAGLISASTIENGDQYREVADSLFEVLAEEYDSTTGVYTSKSVYSADDVAWIIGGLSSLVQQGNGGTKGSAISMLLGFYESTISLGGMQLSAPPGKSGAMAGAWEMDLPSPVYYHPADTPPPAMVGKLPVPAEEITWDGSAWEVTNDRFVPAGAMHLANELNWLGPHLGSVPFPLAPGTSTDLVDGSSASPVTAATIIGENIEFDTRLLSVQVGEVVTITFENRDDGVPHNFHVRAGAEGDFKTEIAQGPLTQTLTFSIDEPGEYAYLCDVHPSQMQGTLVVN